MVSNNEYEIAADFVKEISKGFNFSTTEEECSKFYSDFEKKFSPSALKSISRDDLPSELFSSNKKTNDYLTYWLESQSFSKEWLGTISDESAFAYPLHQGEDGKWITGTGANPDFVSDDRAKDIAEQTREMLTKGAELIESSTLQSVDDYKVMAGKVKDILGNYSDRSWIHKYYQCIFPDKFAAFQNKDWQSHILYLLNIQPDENNFVRSGQIALVRKKTGLCWSQFAERMYRYGAMESNEDDRIVRFVRVGVTANINNKKICYMKRWLEKKYVAIGWNGTEELSAFYDGKKFQKSDLAGKLLDLYYHDMPKGKSVASRKAGELKQFYLTGADSKYRDVFVAMNGQTPYALGVNIGEYQYQEAEPFAHVKSIEWHTCFDEGERLPIENEKNLTSCVEFDRIENILFLMNKLYKSIDKVGTMNIPDEEKVDTGNTAQQVSISDVSLAGEGDNKIYFGAPGTGKSYLMEKEIKERIQKQDAAYERVTFHPEYSYAQFVGTYKPSSDKDNKITYKFVPGPFIRVLADAYESIQKGIDRPHILAIEEINRAKPAAVFGDVFQLLDRDENGVSKYAISTSDELKAYLCERLKGSPEQYETLRIPGNMFIWATMNSADQGVYPMDTAFKRRWEFEYIDINDGEDNVDCTFVVNGKTYDWNLFRHEINDRLSVELKINEDKLLGPFFVDPKYLKKYDSEDSKDFLGVFKNKIIMYLFEDAGRQYRTKIFKNCTVMRYSVICKEFEKNGMAIFGDSFDEACTIDNEQDDSVDGN